MKKKNLKHSQSRKQVKYCSVDSLDHVEIQETTKKGREIEEKVVDLFVSTRKIKASTQEHGVF